MSAGAGTAGWRIPLRLAARSTRAHPGRSTLLAALVLLPVMAGTAAGVVATTATVSPQEYAAQALGSADLRVERPADPAAGAADPAALLPVGTRLAADGWTSLVLRSAGAEVPAPARLVDLGDPVTQGLYVGSTGRPARAAGEVVLSPALAQRLGVDVGDAVSSPGLGGPLRVTGTVRDASDTGRVFAVLPPVVGPGAPEQWLADLPSGSTADAAAARLTAAGYGATTRAALLERGGELGRGSGRDRAAILGLELLALGEVALVIGAAFAVVARSQRRELGLLAAAGAGPRVQRRVVLAQAAVVGVVGTLAGSLAGLAAAALAVGPLAARAGVDWGPLAVPVDTLVPVALAGLLASLLAAVLPARAAGRLSTTQALRDADAEPARGTARTRRAWAGLAVAGALVLALGVAGAAGGLVLLGAALLGVVGARGLVPAFRAAGRAATRLPVVPRLAVRDAARRPGRSSALAAAVAGLVAFTVLLAVVLSSVAARTDDSYVAALPEAVAQVRGVPALSAAELAAVSAALPVQASGAYRWATRAVPGGPGAQTPALLLSPALRCAAARGLLQGGDLDGCTSTTGFPVLMPQLGLADPPTVELLLRRPLTAAERTAYDRGEALALHAGLVQPDGALHVGGLSSFGPRPGAGQAPVRVPVLVAEPARAHLDVPLALLSPAAADRYGLQAGPDGGTLLALPGRPSRAAEDRGRLLLNQVSPVARDLAVERGPQAGGLAARLQVVLLLVTALTAVGTTVVAVALATAEMRTDLATFAAVGAAPRRRRRLTAAQGLVVALAGVGLGAGVGAIGAAGVVWSLDLPVTAGPVAGLAAVVLSLPLAAAACGYLAAPRRLPLTRRAA